MFHDIYIKVFNAVIDDIVSKKYESSEVVDLVIEAICYIKRLKQQQLSEFIKEIENNVIDKEKWLTNEEKHWLENTQTEKLRELLANPKELAKCIDVLLYKADSILRVISIFGSKLTDIPISKQSSKLRFKSDISEYIKTNQERNFLIDSCYNTSQAKPIYLPVFLIILRKLKINANRIDCENLSLSMDDADKVNSYFKELHKKVDKRKGKATEYEVEQSASDTSESSLDENIEIIQEPVKFSIICYPKLQDLIVSCLQGNGQKIQENVNTILDIAALNNSEFKKESLAFVFHAAMKALMLSGVEDNFDILLSAFRSSKPGFAPEGLSVKELLGTELYKKILVVDDELDQNNIFDCYLGTILESMDIHNLLKYATLLDKNNILYWMWENLIIQSEQEPIELLKRSIEGNTSILSYNRLEVIKWYQEKLQGCDNVVNRMTNLWKIGRDWGGGVYHKMLENNSISLALGLEDKYSPKDILELLYHTIQEGRVDKEEIWELICDLAINSTDVNYLEQAFSTLPLKDDSYVYSRLVATAVIKNNMEMLEKFWEVIGKLENEELKNKIKKRALVDSTWAFHKALRDGNIEIMNCVWSKIDELPKEEVVGDYGYRCELLYGLDVYGFNKINPIINAVISGKIKVLNWVYEKMGIVVNGMLGAEAAEEDVKRLDEIMASSERRKGIIHTLRRDYYHNENFGELGYIPVLYSNSSYLKEITNCEYIKNDIERHKFIENAKQVENLLKDKSLEQPGPSTAKRSRYSDLDSPEQPRRSSPSSIVSLSTLVEELNFSLSPK